MAGGLGTRMRSAVPKHLHPILGRRMVDWVLEAARPLDPAPLVERRARGRLVGEDQAWIIDKCPCNGDTLLLSAR